MNNVCKHTHLDSPCKETKVMYYKETDIYSLFSETFEKRNTLF